MSKTKASLNIIGSISLVFLVLIFACQEPEEGCLDVEADNYDVSADDPCSDCCTYPSISIDVAHRFDTLLFSFDSIYYFPETSLIPTQLEQIIFYLSDFRLVNLSDDSLTVFETIELDLFSGGMETFTDDYVLMSRSIPSFSYEVGEIRGAGSFNTLRFSVGIAGEAALSDALTQPDGHPLALGTDSLWNESEGYVFNRIMLIPDTFNTIAPVRTIDIRGEDAITEINLAFSQEVTLGFDVSIPLKIDYKEWLSGIDFVGDTDIEIAEKIVNNTANAFSINE